MSIFDEQAIEAAAKALDSPKVQRLAWNTDRAKAALEAALASLEERGKISQGSYKLYGDAGAGNFNFGNLNFFKGDCDFAIIRMEKL